MVERIENKQYTTLTAEQIQFVFQRDGYSNGEWEKDTTLTLSLTTSSQVGVIRARRDQVCESRVFRIISGFETWPANLLVEIQPRTGAGCPTLALGLTLTLPFWC